MKALHVFPFFGGELVHGGEAHAYMLSRKLVERGVAVDVFTTRSQRAHATSAFSLEFRDDYPLGLERADGIAIHRFGTSVAMPPALGRMISRLMFRRWRREEERYGGVVSGSRNLVESYHQRALARPAAYDALALLGRGPHSVGLVSRLVRSVRAYDVVLVGSMPFALVWQVVAVARAFGKPVVALALFHPEDLYHHFGVYYRSLSRTAAVLAQTSYSAELFRRLCPGTRPVQVGPGVDDARFTQPTISGDRFRARYGLKDKRVVLYVGRKEPAKRYDLAVKAVELIGDDDITLVMVGADVDGQPLRSSRVVYLGPLSADDLLDAYDGCDVFILPSEHESFGMVFLEAWMRRKPVIGNAVCKPVASMIRDGEDGFVCTGAGGMAQAIVRVLANPALARRMGEAGYRRVSQHHTWNAIGDTVQQLYEEIVHGPSPRREIWERPAPVVTPAAPPEAHRAVEHGDEPAPPAAQPAVTRGLSHETYNDHDALRFPLNVGSHDVGFRYMFDFTVAGRSLNLRPGAEVLDFASGSCFVSELLNRFGYITTALDVDPGILALGRQRLALDPRCEPARARFVAAEGLVLPFRDESFDGLICMNALHHMLDYRAALREMYRVLRPGGRAVFSEPGSEHSKGAHSINAIKQFGAVERDIILAEINELALEVGFRRMILKPYVYPEHVDLRFGDLERFRRGEPVSTPNVTAGDVAGVLERSHSVFCLEKDGPRTLTSATAPPDTLRAKLMPVRCPTRVRAGTVLTVAVKVQNRGQAVWLAQPRPFGGYVTLGVKLLTSDGRLLDDGRGRTLLPRDLRPGEVTDLPVEISLAGLKPGRYTIAFDMVSERVCWFQDMGSPVDERSLEIV